MRVVAALKSPGDRIGNGEASSPKRLIDEQPHSRQRPVFGRVVVYPESSAISDRRVGEVHDDHLRLWFLRNHRFVFERRENRGLYLVWRIVVGCADFHFETGQQERLRVIRNRFLRQGAVRYDQEIARLGADLRRAPGNLVHHAVLTGDVNPVADAKRFLDLDRKAGEQIAERVLQREADDHGAHGGGRDDLFLQDDRRGNGEQGNRQRVLHDVGKAIGRPIDAPRVDHDRDDAADDAPGKQQRCKRDDLLAEICGEISVIEQAVGERVPRKRQGGPEQPAAHVAVAGSAAQRKRRRKQDQADDHGAHMVQKKASANGGGWNQGELYYC